MHELKAGLNTDKFVTFERFPKRFYHSFVLQMTLVYTLYNRLNASRLRRFWKKHENMWIISVKRNAELFLDFLRLLSRKQRLNQNSSIDFL